MSGPVEILESLEIRFSKAEPDEGQPENGLNRFSKPLMVRMNLDRVKGKSHQGKRRVKSWLLSGKAKQGKANHDDEFRRFKSAVLQSHQSADMTILRSLIVLADLIRTRV